MREWPRVAFFADSFHSVNGVGMTSRNLVKAAGRREFPLLSVRTGDQTRRWQDGPIDILELKQGPIGFAMDRDLRFDLLFMRHFRRALKAVREFKADIIHITSPGDVGILGGCIAGILRMPLVASWHTNLHTFASRRLWNVTSFLPSEARQGLADAAEKSSLWACMCFYANAGAVLAPNEEDVRMLRSETGLPAFPMSRGIDTNLFSRTKRTLHDGTFRLGFVGRLTPEKNVRFLAQVEAALKRDGLDNYRFLIVGDGSERAWLEGNLLRADFTGELFGEDLARAYANMDLFLFPSETDTFGNVVLEALSSGTPAIVTSEGGPKFLVRDGVTGFVAHSDQDFIGKVKLLLTDHQRYLSLRETTQSGAATKSWESVLDEIYDAYESCILSDMRRNVIKASSRYRRDRSPQTPESSPSLADN